jgi:hypothetical protein
MDFPHLKRKLSALFSPFTTTTRRLAVGTTLLTLAAGQQAVNGSQPSNQQTIDVPERQVRKYSTKYVLRHSPRLGAFIQLVSHHSHSSHASHASHSSHYSGSSGGHYSHYSSSAAPPAPRSAPAPKSAPVEPARSVASEEPVTASFWTEGLPIRATTRDTKVAVTLESVTTTITTLAGVSGSHFNGVMSTRRYDLTSYAPSVLVLQAARGGRTRFAVVADADNWYGMSVFDGILIFERRVNGVESSKSMPYSGYFQRYWRLRKTGLTSHFIWESSRDGTQWVIEQAEQPAIPLTSVTVSLSAGTERAEKLPGAAIFTDFHLRSAAE